LGYRDVVMVRGRTRPSLATHQLAELAADNVDQTPTSGWWGLGRGGGSGGRGFRRALGEPPAFAVSGGSGGQQLTRTRATGACPARRAPAWRVATLWTNADLNPESSI